MILKKYLLNKYAADSADGGGIGGNNSVHVDYAKMLEDLTTIKDKIALIEIPEKVDVSGIEVDGVTLQGDVDLILNKLREALESLTKIANDITPIQEEYARRAQTAVSAMGGSKG